MKKLIILIVVLVLVGSVLIAARPAPVPSTTHYQFMQGLLRWERVNVCGVSDYVANEAMSKVFLTGKFVPTDGHLAGCRITAVGAYYRAGGCLYFNVDSYELACYAP